MVGLLMYVPIPGPTHRHSSSAAMREHNMGTYSSTNGGIMYYVDTLTQRGHRWGVLLKREDTRK